jgi:hypothetical protein
MQLTLQNIELLYFFTFAINVYWAGAKMRLDGESEEKETLEDMILITPEETSSPLNEDIERLQTNLRGFARDIENLQERVQSGDVTDAETRKVFSDLRSWLRMAMETEKALAQQNRQRLEIDGDYGLDLDAARDKIGCRLARLRRCTDTGHVSE